MRKIAMVSLKGGVGKTVSAAAVAVGLAKSRTQNACRGCGPAKQSDVVAHGRAGGRTADSGIGLDPRVVRRAEAIRPTTTPGLDLLPADGLPRWRQRLAGSRARPRHSVAVRTGSDRWSVRFHRVRYWPPATTVLVNVLVYAVEVVVPLDPGVYAMLGLVASLKKR